MGPRVAETGRRHRCPRGVRAAAPTAARTRGGSAGPAEAGTANRTLDLVSLEGLEFENGHFQSPPRARRRSWLPRVDESAR